MAIPTVQSHVSKMMRRQASEAVELSAYMIFAFAPSRLRMTSETVTQLCLRFIAAGGQACTFGRA
jgi:hypothetical protein